MTKTIRIGGAQIPIHDRDISKNKIEIFKAIDWAKENSVDILQTPECALSGYNFKVWNDNIEESQNAVQEVVDYAKEAVVGLNLGTFYLDEEYYGSIKRNQIRHYAPNGEVYGLTNKTYCVDADGSSVFNFHSIKDTTFQLPYELKCVGMICNDMWGASQETGKDYKPIIPLNQTLNDMNLDLIFHCTNGFKFEEDLDPKEGCNSLEKLPSETRFTLRDMFDQWHESWLRMTAFNAITTIVTVDSCVQWDWNGDEELVDKCKTASPSGVVNCLGGWDVQAPRYGRQYFKWDYDPGTKKKYWDLLNSKTDGTWKYTDMIDFDKTKDMNPPKKVNLILP